MSVSAHVRSEASAGDAVEPGCVEEESVSLGDVCVALAATFKTGLAFKRLEGAEERCPHDFELSESFLIRGSVLGHALEVLKRDLDLSQFADEVLVMIHLHPQRWFTTPSVLAGCCSFAVRISIVSVERGIRLLGCAPALAVGTERLAVAVSFQ